jgi:hypothetical protein
VLAFGESFDQLLVSTVLWLNCSHGPSLETPFGPAIDAIPHPRPATS